MEDSLISCEPTSLRAMLLLGISCSQFCSELTQFYILPGKSWCMDYSVFWTHIWFLVSFSDSVNKKAFTERYEIYLGSTFMSVGKSAILWIRLPNVFFGFVWMEHPELWPIQNSDSKIAGKGIGEQNLKEEQEN